MTTDSAKALMTAAAEAALRGDADAVAKTEKALAEIHRGRCEESTVLKEPPCLLQT